MKVAVWQTDRMFAKWPEGYIDELTAKLIERGHRVFVILDGSDKNADVVNMCDVYVGAPGEWADMARSQGKRVVLLLGPTLTGDGVKSPIVCAGCLEKLDRPHDCFFGDDLCFWEITPNDVLEAV